MSNHWNDDNSYDADDTPQERALRRAVSNLRTSLKELVRDIEYAQKRLDDGQRPSGSLFPGRVVDAAKANAYAAQIDALLDLPTWVGPGVEENVDRIVRYAGTNTQVLDES